jgi:cell division protein FtsI (penicillin-binding protein 3)
VTHALPQPHTRIARASLALVVGVTGVFAILFARVAQLQIAPGDDLKAQMVARTTTRGDLPARGDLVDRRGRLIATTAFARRVVIDPTVFAKDRDLSAEVARLARAVGLPPNDLEAKVRNALAENSRRDEVAQNWPDSATVDGATTDRATGLAARSQTSASVPPHPVLVARDVQVPAEDPFAPAQAAGKRAEALAAGKPFPKDLLPQEPKTTEQPSPPKPIRYLALTDLLTHEQESAVRALMKRGKDNPQPLLGTVLERQQVREFAGGDAMAPLVGKVGFAHKGMMGAEYRLEDTLSGEEGSLTYVRDRSGRPLWVEPTGVIPATPGTSVRLSLDTELQRIAHEEIAKQVEDMNAAGGRCVMADPNTGEVLVMVDIVRDVPGAIPFPWSDAPKPGEKRTRTSFDPGKRYQVIPDDPGRKVHPALARNRCVEDIYEPGSTFKPFVWATITELGRAKPDETIDTENGTWVTPDGRPLSDVTARATMTWQQVLINSSNIGMVKVGTRLTPQELHDAVARFGFGQRTNIGLPGEATGLVTPLARWKTPTHTSVSYGHELGVTPVQMVRAFSAFARRGDSAGTLPKLRLLASDTQAQGPTVRVLPPDVAQLTRHTMKFVVDAVDRNAAKKDMPVGGWRYTMFGKSGTAKIPITGAPSGKVNLTGEGYFDNQFISSFLSAGPVEDPKLVCLVIIDDPGPREGVSRRSRYGASAAGPAARRIMERSLTYLGVPASPDEALPAS